MKTGASGELALFAAWAVALIATLSVLFTGEVLGQTPCILCWYQPCTADGPSCTDENQLFLGMPIPLLSLAAFSAIIFLLMAAQPETDT